MQNKEKIGIEFFIRRWRLEAAQIEKNLLSLFYCFNIFKTRQLTWFKPPSRPTKELDEIGADIRWIMENGE